MPRTRARRPLTLAETDGLLAYLEDRLPGGECDGTMRHVETFLRERGMDLGGTLEWLRHCGAWCDCEVWMNVR